MPQFRSYLLAPFAVVAMTLTVAQSVTVAQSTTIRSGEGWGIHTQREPGDWTKLVAGGNLVAKKLVRAEPDPNDHNTGSDLQRLTDGELAGAEGRMWSDKRAMGWAYQPYARLTFDLGESRPIGQVVMRLQVISKDSTLPSAFTVALSDDGDAFTPVRKLSVRAKPDENTKPKAKANPNETVAATYEALPAEPPGIYAVVLDLDYQARYVRLDFALRGTMVTDELAIVPAAGKVRKVPPQPKVETEYRNYVFDRRDQFRKLIASGNLLSGRELRYAQRQRST